MPQIVMLVYSEVGVLSRSRSVLSDILSYDRGPERPNWVAKKNSHLPLCTMNYCRRSNMDYDDTAGCRCGWYWGQVLRARIARGFAGTSRHGRGWRGQPDRGKRSSGTHVYSRSFWRVLRKDRSIDRSAIDQRGPVCTHHPERFAGLLPLSWTK